METPEVSSAVNRVKYFAAVYIFFSTVYPSCLARSPPVLSVTKRPVWAMVFSSKRRPRPYVIDRSCCSASTERSFPMRAAVFLNGTLVHLIIQELISTYNAR